ncbi:MAG: YgfZ/GcvT domain-containing protein [Terracidiphilus sp.]
MSDSAIATTALVTPLAAHLTAAAVPPRLVEHRCVHTPQELDASASEIAALTSSAGVHDLGWMRRVAVRGEDRFRWLSGMVSNTVHDLGPHGGAWNLVLNAQGRIQGDLTTWREGDSLELEIAADQYARLLAHLEHFIIMDDVELVPLGQENSAETALGLTGPRAAEVLERAGLPRLLDAMTLTRIEWNGLDLGIRRNYGAVAQHYEIWTPIAGMARLWRTLSTAGAIPVGVAMLEAFRIAEGIPAYGVDIVERDLPQETAQMRALHFSKGCYLGQEIVERIRSRGNVHKHLRPLELEGPVPGAGTELLIGDVQAGLITSAAALPLAGGSRVFAMGMIRSEAEARNEPLTYRAGETTGSARILAAPPQF